MKQAVLKSTGLLVGMIIGAGMFALPYVVIRSGVLWTAIHFTFAAFLITSVHLLYGQILYHNHERHRLPGYAREHLGHGWYSIALVSRLFSYYGYLLAYGVLGGIFLAELVPSVSPQFFGVLFFIVLAPLLLLGVRGIGTIDLFLAIPLVAFVVLLFLFLAPSFNFDHVTLLPRGGDWLLPYGVFLFAFSGASAIPEVVDLIGSRGRRAFGHVVIASTVIAALVYILFVTSIVGIVGNAVEEHALSSLKASAPYPLFVIGILIGLLAIATSYIALGVELRFTFEYDLFEKKIVAWFFTASVPLALYLLGVTDFVLILSIIGAVGVGLEGMLIALLARKLIHASRTYTYLLIAFFSLGAVLECFHVVGLM